MPTSNEQVFSTISAWLDSAQVQIASESYLQGVLAKPRELRVSLLAGNTPSAYVDATGQQIGEGSIRLVGSADENLGQQIDRFLDKYEIIDQHANDSSGFSATLLRTRSGEPDAGRYVLAFRSTEAKNPIPGALGGDFDRDGYYGADGEIQKYGYAFGQLLAMQRYWQRLQDGYKDAVPSLRDTQDADLRAALSNSNTQIDVVGYSLGGHLANVFVSTYSDRVNKAYLFNAAGRGKVDGAPLSSLQNAWASAFQELRDVLANPDGFAPTLQIWSDLGEFGRAQQLWNDAKRETWNEEKWLSPDPQGYDQFKALARRNVYEQSALYRYAKAYVTKVHQFEFNPTAPQVIAGIRADTATTEVPGYAKITQVFGHANSGDSETTANSGIHAPAISVFIEGQPFVEGGIPKLPFAPFATDFLEKNGDYLNAHSLTLVVDSLALMSVLMKADGSLTKQQTESIFAASSNRQQKVRAGKDDVNGAEFDALENALDAARRALDPSAIDTPAQGKPGDYGRDQFRNKFYKNLYALEQTVSALQGISLRPLVNADQFRADNGEPIANASAISATDLVSSATSGADSLAYRYALKHLTPFVIIGAPAIAAQTSALATFDAGTMSGALSDSWVTDRAAMLSAVTTRNIRNLLTSSAVVASGTVVATQFRDRSNPDQNTWTFSVPATLRDGVGQRIEFGIDGDDSGSARLQGGRLDDHLYGMDGSDVLSGGDGVDLLSGGRGDDLLDGGRGNDVYLYVPGDGKDVISDPDGTGSIRIGNMGAGGYALGTASLTSRDTWKDANGLSYTFQGTSLDRGGRLTISGDNLGGAGNIITVENYKQSGASGSLALGLETPNRVLAQSSGLGLSIDWSKPRAIAKAVLVQGAAQTIEFVASTVSSVVRRFIVNAVGSAGGIFGVRGDDTVPLDNGPIEVTLEAGQTTATISVIAQGDVATPGVVTLNVSLADAANPNAPAATSTMYLDVQPGAAPTDGQIANTIQGDRAPALDGEGQAQYDQWGNPVPGDPTPGRADTLFDTPADDRILGLDGDDTITSTRGGRDELDGGAGDDSLSGGAQEDKLIGGWLLGGAGADELQGDAGNDYLSGEAGDDKLFGGEGNDTLTGDSYEFADGSAYSITGLLKLAQRPGETLNGTAGSNLVEGGTGDDRIVGGAGNDTLKGGYGADTYHHLRRGRPHHHTSWCAMQRGRVLTVPMSLFGTSKEKRQRRAYGHCGRQE